MTDYAQEQEMEIEALEAILMDDFKEIHSSESGLNTSNRCFQIKVIPQDDEGDELSTPVELALIFSHTEKYPDEPPLLNVKSLRGIHTEDLRILKENLEQEASENLGMAMVYTLVSSAKEWLSERYGVDTNAEDAEAEEATKDDDPPSKRRLCGIHCLRKWNNGWKRIPPLRDRFLELFNIMREQDAVLTDHLTNVELDTLCWNPSPLNVFEVKSYYKMLHSTPHLSFPWCCMWKPKVSSKVIIPHGEPVTVETFLAWRERFEAELALERAKLMPESALTAPKEKRLSGRQWFESGRGSARGPVAVAEGSDVEDEEDIDFDDDDFEDDEEDMLEHYLAEKSESPSHS
uniref:RWD domain-containing protein n=1 Tax=Quercus lobata TaxID=97700 RepID=A0A7N2LMH3_QUELO